MGCAVGSIGLLTSGQWSLYIVGAPAVVNQAFPATLASTSPFFVRCADGAPPALTIDSGTRGVPGPSAVAAGIPANAIAYRFLVSGVDLTNIVFTGTGGAPPPCPPCQLPVRVSLGSAWGTFARGLGSNATTESGARGPSLFIDPAAPAGSYPFTLTLPDGRTVQGTVSHTQ